MSGADAGMPDSSPLVQLLHFTDGKTKAQRVGEGCDSPSMTRCRAEEVMKAVCWGESSQLWSWIPVTWSRASVFHQSLERLPDRPISGG